MEANKILDIAFDKEKPKKKKRFSFQIDRMSTKLDIARSYPKCSTDPKAKLSHYEVRQLGPVCHAVMESLLMTAHKTKDMRLKISLFRECAPYLLRKQPIGIDGGEGKPLQVEAVRISLEKKLSRLTAVSDVQSN